MTGPMVRVDLLSSIKPLWASKDRPNCVSQVISKTNQVKKEERPSQFPCLHLLEVV